MLQTSVLVRLVMEEPIVKPPFAVVFCLLTPVQFAMERVLVQLQIPAPVIQDIQAL